MSHNLSPYVEREMDMLSSGFAFEVVCEWITPKGSKLQTKMLPFHELHYNIIYINLLCSFGLAQYSMKSHSQCAFQLKPVACRMFF